MFDNSLLTDKVFVEQTKAQIGLYLETNYTTDVSKSTRFWEAFKAYMRGQISSHSISIKKWRKEQKKKLTDRILEIDCEYATSPSPELYKKNFKNSPVRISVTFHLRDY